MSSASSESDPILVSYHDSIVRLSNLKTLDDSNWLDDNIITFAFEYLQYESKYIHSSDNLLFAFVTPPVVQLIKMSDDLFAEQLLQSIDFLQKKFLILPINNNTQVAVFGGSHWSLLILSIQDKILYHFDSMSLSNDRTAKEMHKKFQAFFHDNINLINTRCPQQKNAFDCGLYVIVIVEEFKRFIYENCILKKFDDQKLDKDLFEKFINEISQCMTSESVNQRRKQLKAILESMRTDRKK
ncbi:unnamed protein product [Rotaria socialis]|uniref:Ubiquitin-like protease family profile domain-containing protein n=3 Tax=Rotaria socialis TaxID=392032 RepID=A0A820SZI3_9BILA|nr:unnamed protein product [Rotaria socialis]CAF4507767.1 unnamed protein product [Rotaria socialis]